MIRNIRHIQIKKIAYHPNLFKAIITYEVPNIEYDESDDIELMKSSESDSEASKKENKKWINNDKMFIYKHINSLEKRNQTILDNLDLMKSSS
tara:strand:- start:2569 stop:2847 length:279 start_codon:yes stop_codon:yes gene_type:complete